MTLPSKPASREGKVSILKFARLFQKDIFAALPARFYRAWMAEFRTPFFRSFMCNDPELVDLVLKQRPDDFPKSDRIREGLAPLLRNSVFVTNGEVWKKQRRIIDPAFEGGNLRDTFPAMVAAGQSAVERFKPLANGSPVEVELHSSHVAADVIFRTLFSIPIEHELAMSVFQEFQTHQRSQPVVNLGALLPLPRWFPRFHRRKTRTTARNILQLIEQLVQNRMEQIRAGTAPDDLASKIMTTADPEDGTTFGFDEVVDQISIFFLAGHETSASALAWASYLLALYPEWQDQVANEAQGVFANEVPQFSDMSKLRITRDVFREALRLYSPVPMMVREARCPQEFRGRKVPKGAQIVLSPWHLHRHERLWEDPDAFNPARFQTENGRACLRNAYMPFSAGQRVCPGAGFAMIEGPLLLAMLVARYRFEAIEGQEPVPEAHLTVRSKDGIWLKISPR
ncbi:cytochrome P450 [Roseovarius sp. EL26]|uniref:cytochrome P450 n=1 Tax=Roseovarius sp. EL26 TaxID=2126672 RepID=UPI000EA2D15C|nr:cytochrome P450 [Roseovarius sp. EL26]